MDVWVAFVWPWMAYRKRQLFSNKAEGDNFAGAAWDGS